MNVVMKNRGITLIALVITIIILLILAGVSIGVEGSSIINRTELASTQMKETTVKEKLELVCGELEISKYSNGFAVDLKSSIENIDGIDNVKVFENSTDNSTKNLNESSNESSSQSTYIEFDYNNEKYAFTIEDNKIEESNLFLKGNVKVGDYINYPVEYDDEFTNTHYTGINGWRVIDDGVMQGTSGNVRIISTYIPAKFSYIPDDYGNSVDNVISSLTNNFESQEFINGFTGEKISGSYFNDGNFCKKVTTLTLEDLNCSHNSLYRTQRESNETTPLNQNDNLFLVSQMTMMYWIASKQQDNNLDMYFMSQFGILSASDTRLGIRPVIVLKDNLKGEKENEVWSID